MLGIGSAGDWLPTFGNVTLIGVGYPKLGS